MRNGSNRIIATFSSPPRSNAAAALPAISENSGTVTITPRILSSAAATTEWATLPPASEQYAVADCTVEGSVPR